MTVGQRTLARLPVRHDLQAEKAIVFDAVRSDDHLGE